MALSIGLAFVAALVAPASAMADGLGRVEWLVDQRFDVPEVTVGDARAALSADSDGWLIVDVREPEEYAISHLPGAVRVPPDADAEAFMQAVGGKVAGRGVLFYCSVGQRSSKLAARVQDAVSDAGGTGVANLRGGIFRWHGEHGPLVNAAGPVDRIHPYNAVWGRLMPRDNPPEPALDESEKPK